MEKGGKKCYVIWTFFNDFWSCRVKKRPHFSLLLLPEFSLLPYASFLDKLRFSSDEADFSSQKYCSWTSYALDKDLVASSCGSMHKVTSLSNEDNLTPFYQSDFVVVFGGRNISSAIDKAQTLKPLIKKAYALGAHLVSIDNAVFSFAQSGMLSDQKVTVHWRHHQQFLAMFPRLNLAKDLLFETQNRITTCVGGTATVELAIELISTYLGKPQANKGLADMIIEQPRLNQLEPNFADIPNVNDPILNKALIHIFESIAHRQTIEDIANRTGISRRQLDRKMEKQFQCSASQYLHQLKMKQARWLLLNTPQSVSQIAESVGFDNLEYFRQAFKRFFNKTPSKVRDEASQ